MIQLSGIFADYALFLHSAPLTISGIGVPHAFISLTLTCEGKTVVQTEDVCDADGHFALSFQTPAPSYREYELTLQCEEDTLMLHHLLFGELWLCMGQSNMELPNSWQKEREEMFSSLTETRVRSFRSDRLSPAANYPEEPLAFHSGSWADSTCSEHRMLWQKASATATAFAKEIFHFLKKEKSLEIPVGICDVSMGGTKIAAYFADGYYEKHESISAYLKSIGTYPTPENWNQQGEKNYQQVSCQYRLQVHSLLGVKYRGILWYQGESDQNKEVSFGMYETELKHIRDSYKILFAPSEEEPFPLIASQIFPYPYEPNGNCRTGYINQAISNLARKYPRQHPVVSICDLSPSWAFHLPNSLIHPTHKYEHGKRMALLCENLSYGRTSGDGQCTSPLLRDLRRDGDRLILTFSDVGSGLRVEGSRPRCLYVRSANSAYLPAQCEILSEDTLAVFYPGLLSPEHVSYAVSDMDFGANLYAGEFPIAPFSTELCPGKEELIIQLKDWLLTDQSHRLEIFLRDDEKFPLPASVFHPLEGCEICEDTVFAQSDRSIRIHGQPDRQLGCFVLSKTYRELDLNRYLALRLSLFNVGGLTPSLRVSYPNASVTLTAQPLDEAFAGWQHFEFDLSNLPDETAQRMDFLFSFDQSSFYPFTVNMDEMLLVPKQ